MRKYFCFCVFLFLTSNLYAVTAKEYYDTGLKLYSANDYKQAIKYFDAALQMEPDNVGALMGRANCHYSQKKYQHALVDFQKVQALQPQNTQVSQFIQALQAKIDSAPRWIAWKTPSEGLEESQRTQKPILYDITAEWCGYCHKLSKEVFENDKLAARINLLFVPVRVIDRIQEDGKNTEEVANLLSRFKSDKFPTLVVQFPGKSDFKKFTGYGGRKRTMNFLNAAIQ